MIVSFEGLMGQGKTTAAIGLAYEEHERTGMKVISNTHLNFEYTHFDLAWFLEHVTDHEMENCIIILDEMYQLADARSSATKLNKLFTYFVVQTRKRGVDLYICTHSLDYVDKRLRRAVDIRGSCRFRLEKPCRKCYGTGQYKGESCPRCYGYGMTGWEKVYFLDRRLRRRYTLDFLGPRYWPLFDTWERIPMQARILSGIETAEVV